MWIVRLALRRTYTAEFTPNVRGIDGTPLPPNVYFQFTTNSVPRVRYDYPTENALEGPVAPPAWARKRMRAARASGAFGSSLQA